MVGLIQALRGKKHDHSAFKTLVFLFLSFNLTSRVLIRMFNSWSLESWVFIASAATSVSSRATAAALNKMLYSAPEVPPMLLFNWEMSELVFVKIKQQIIALNFMNFTVLWTLIAQEAYLSCYWGGNCFSHHLI